MEGILEGDSEGDLDGDSEGDTEGDLGGNPDGDIEGNHETRGERETEHVVDTIRKRTIEGGEGSGDSAWERGPRC